MTKLFTELSVNAQTAYAQLLEAALTTEHFRSVADLPGSFASKLVKGHRYWYFQYTEPSGKLKQVFVGPDSDAVKALMSKKIKKQSPNSYSHCQHPQLHWGAQKCYQRIFV